MLALLVALVLLVVTLPMLPALREWRWPSDVQPLVIDETDALDPPFLARSFAARLAEAVQAGASHLGESALVRVAPACADALLLPSDAERTAGASHRLWSAAGDVCLPAGIAFYAEVSAAGTLQTATHGVYRALWAGQRLVLAARSAVLRWAHGQDVVVAGDCDLAGRVTADRQLALAAGTRFTLLHAPCVRFLPLAPLALQPVHDSVELQGVSWDARRQRALASASLVVADDTAWRGDLVCHGDLTLGQRCVVDGSLKARGQITLGPGCRVSGSVFADKAVQLGTRCTVRGVLVSETRIGIASACVIGAPGALATVSAPQIEVASGAVVHGTLWASEQGRCVAAAPMAAAHPEAGP